ncbi:hypothetical protein [Vulcanisaeta souniana]|uniref:Uncharacterized protein n=1 Tax=Vulcanisaeta souniana JCM 11219 TaxID=1293586 RepID=A0A830ELV6_9CREN|nr:hypothetical protein [Vulcanisaeta souniana]BDR92960.1 hypothetical protein Vsou_20530 [Vulcanisaeta souniana JCM 11219]GGI83890.1 hypothetical protein GCM10007112_20970 [Vulcanisaeta souniana JCM 11219]
MSIDTNHSNDAEEFRKVLRVLVNGERVNVNPDTLRLAGLNKVLLHVLRIVDYQGDLRREQEERLRRIINMVREIEYALEGIDHAFIKLVKPVIYVPADIDILVRKDQVLLATIRLIRRGYSVLLYEPYTITLVKDGINVDLYVHPSAASLVYARGEEFLDLKATGEYHGVKITTIERHAEVVLAILHAVYKEGIITLNDALTVMFWLNNDAVNLCARLGCMNAMELALSVTYLAIRKSLILPYKLPISVWFTYLLTRTLGNRRYTSSILQGIKRVGDGKFIPQLINRIMRTSY